METNEKGEYVKKASSFRDWITGNGSFTAKKKKKNCNRLASNWLQTGKMQLGYIGTG